MTLKNPDSILGRLKLLQSDVREAVIQSRWGRPVLHEVQRSSPADTIYRLDHAVEPMIDRLCEDWGEEDGPLIVIAEGLADEQGNAVERRVYPSGATEKDAEIVVILDPIDGTRGLMYDKRSAWTLAGVAPNRGPETRLRDIEIAVMSELPTSKMGSADVLWAFRGQGACGERVELEGGDARPLPIAPSKAVSIDHGFAMVTHFFPATKAIAGELMQEIAGALVKGDRTQAAVFDDQYISTGGQFYELIVGHDRFNADLRPVFYRLLQQAPGLACHPYDCATALVAEEAGVILTDERGGPLDGPLDTTTGLCWVAYANSALRDRIEPVLMRFLGERGEGPMQGAGRA